MTSTPSDAPAGESRNPESPFPPAERSAPQSQPPERRVLYHAIGAAVVILSLALGVRIITAEGDVDVAGGTDGLSVKISQAQTTIESAKYELEEAKKQLDAREAALTSAELALRDKERRVQELLDTLTSTVTSSSKPKLHDVSNALKQLQAERPTRGLPAPPAGAYTLQQRVSKIDDLQRELTRTNESLKEFPSAAPK